MEYVLTIVFMLGGTDDSRFDESESSELVTHPAYTNLLVDIVGHPAGAPSITELDHTNPGVERDVVRTRIQHLQDARIVSRITFDEGDRIAEYPRRFYRLTDPARNLFEEMGLFPKDAWRRTYDCIEKSAEIQNIESLPRPEARHHGWQRSQRLADAGPKIH